jgi:cell division septum initiation protein DivIVA
MDPQQLLATLIQLSDEQQHRIAELLNRLEQQTRTLTTASQRATQAANALDHNGQKTALHLQAAVRESVETILHDTLTTLSQRVEGAFQDAGRPLLHTLVRVTKAAEETEERLQRVVKSFRWQWGAIAGGAALAAVVTIILGVWLAVSTLVSWRSAELERLNTAIAQSEARLEALNRRGGKIEFEDCDGRLCVHAAKNQGKDYKNWIGPWYSKKDGSPLVIPRGY